MTEQQEIREKAKGQLPQFVRTQEMNIFDRYEFIDCPKLYLGLYSEIPNRNDFVNIDVKAFTEFFKETYSSQIMREIYVKVNTKKDKEEYEDQVFLLSGEILMKIEHKAVAVFSTEITDVVKTLFSDIRQFRKKKKKKPSKISLIVPSHNSLDTREMTFKKPKINLAEYYNDGFETLHENILRQLSKKKESGLLLFHGKPGTGKSTYLRFLIKHLKKKVIFISPQTAGSLDNVAMTELLIDNKNSILIVEDAEELIVSRNNERNSNLSTLLNLTDGILGECLGIQIIATFNTNVRNIDKALMRKGRLKLVYEFEELSAEKTNLLLQKQGLEAVVNQPMTLADIFNFSEEDLTPEPVRKSVGFNN